MKTFSAVILDGWRDATIERVTKYVTTSRGVYALLSSGQIVQFVPR